MKLFYGHSLLAKIRSFTAVACPFFSRRKSVHSFGIMRPGLQVHMQIAATHCEEAVASLLRHYPDTVLVWPLFHPGLQFGGDRGRGT